MTILEAITKIQNLKPSTFDDSVLIGWLSQIDGSIYLESVLHHHGGEGITWEPYTEADVNKTLIVPEPYSELYIRYLTAQIDLHNAEFGRYNNSLVAFQAAYMDYLRWYNRENLPKQDNYIWV